MKIVEFMKNNILLCLGLVMLLVLLFITFFGKFLPGIDAELKVIEYLWVDKIPTIPPFDPSDHFPLGTDRLGRDLLSLIVLGAKETLLIVVSITVVRYLLAIPLAYFAHKRWLGANAVLNWLNGFLSYIPTIIVVILLVTLPPILETEIRPVFVVLIIAAVEIGRVAEMVKVEFNQISTKEFVKGGNAIGVTNVRLLKNYYMPFLYGRVLVSLVGDMGKVMFLLGQLGFIGIFVAQDFVQIDPGAFEFQNTSLSWPMLLLNAFNDIRGPVWIPFYPALAMTYVILTFNILAQGLQKRLG
ncbi:peptide ABC transporter permease [Robertmurraya andreesenii]|uniref:Peptide/nickel transport system permease protein n=1 Tax=Anoxybacillus andreesenii TaxID=1325932 RepID=A0ABT9V5Q0_9BACL|nr:peptide ABC transporter permease [Robertmurraya andreesenii]MDQ0156268.1 peptide/nickel transport system permease protein [Robertmurraya andreesenii]